jgi:hypothetical protein
LNPSDFLSSGKISFIVTKVTIDRLFKISNWGKIFVGNFGDVKSFHSFAPIYGSERAHIVEVA